MNLNGKRFVSKNGLLDLLQRKTNEDEIRYPIIQSSIATNQKPLISFLSPSTIPYLSCTRQGQLAFQNVLFMGWVERSCSI